MSITVRFYCFDTVVGRQEKHLACKNGCWYSSGGDLSGTLHVLELRLHHGHPRHSCCIKFQYGFLFLYQPTQVILEY